MKELLVPIGANLVVGIILLALFALFALLALLVWKRRPEAVRLLSDADALAEFQRDFPSTSPATRDLGSAPLLAK